MIRLVIADEHHVVRAGLETLIGSFAGMELAGSASDGAQAIGLSLRRRPDLVLIDVDLPRPGTSEAIRTICDGCPGVAIVVLTSSCSDPRRVRRALDAGAIGSLSKLAARGELETAIRAAARGEALPHAQAPPPPVARLSEREREVLSLVAEGQPNKHIARRLGIAEATVKGHVTRIFRRIGVTSRTQAALWAHRNGDEAQSSR